MEKKLKGIYLGFVDANDTYSGVAKKIHAQCKAFRQYDIDMELISHDMNRNIFEKLAARLPFYYRNGIRKCITELNSRDLKQYGFIYIRYSPCGRDFIMLLSRIKRLAPNINLILEFPTFPYDLDINSISRRIYDKQNRNQIYKYVDISVSFGNQETVLGMPCINIINGIDVSSIHKRKQEASNSNIFSIIGVGGLSVTHGYDRIIRGIYQYNQKERTHDMKQIRFDIVGNGSIKKELYKLVKKLKLENIVFHGQKSGEELEQLYAHANIGVGAIAMHRRYHVPIASPLKTKEYCAIGLPFIRTEKDFVFDQHPCDFTILCAEDNSAVDIQGVIDFQRALSAKYEPEALIDNIRSYANNYLNWEATLLPVIDWLYAKHRMVKREIL